jgi:hypothetical protein
LVPGRSCLRRRRPPMRDYVVPSQKQIRKRD